MRRAKAGRLWTRTGQTKVGLVFALGGGVFDMDGASVRGVQDGGLLAHGPGLEVGTGNPNGTMRLHRLFHAS